MKTDKRGREWKEKDQYCCCCCSPSPPCLTPPTLRAAKPWQAALSTNPGRWRGSEYQVP